jgi:GNAT superfamily N-acetyltransferase
LSVSVFGLCPGASFTSLNKKMNTIKAIKTDLRNILDLQKLAYQSEAEIYNDYTIPPLTQSLNDLENDFDASIFLKISENDSIIASVRAFQKANTCYINRVIVHPAHQNRGLGKILMKDIENCFPNAKRFELFTGAKSTKNICFYQKLGYSIFKSEKLNDVIDFVYMEKKIVTFN